MGITNNMRILIILPFIVALAGCAHSTRSLLSVGDFDAGKYVGTWYEIARFPHWFERNLVSVTAHYTIRDDGSIGVENKGYDPARGKWRSVSGRAFFKETKDTALLKVTFFWPFYGTYKVILLDKENYGHAIVTSDTYSYLWILSRTPTLKAETLKALVIFAEASGFDISRLELVDQRLKMYSQQPAGGAPSNGAALPRTPRQ